MAPHRTTIETNAYRGGPGHCFHIEYDHRRTPVRIVEEWVPESEMNRTHHATLPDALRVALDQLRVPLRQKESEARREARPERIAIASAMGRPVDWNRSRQAVTSVVQQLGAVDSLLRILPTMKGINPEHALMTVKRFHVPIAIELAPPKFPVSGLTVEPGTELYAIEDRGDGPEVIDATVMEHRLQGRAGACSLTHVCQETGTDRQISLSAVQVATALDGESKTLFTRKIDAEQALDDVAARSPWKP